MTDDDDHDLMRAWREGAREMPGDLLDRRILAAARAHQARRRAALPLAAALAACLALALFEARPVAVNSHVPAAAIDYGRTSAILADPNAMEALRIRSLPGATAGRERSS